MYYYKKLIFFTLLIGIRINILAYSVSITNSAPTTISLKISYLGGDALCPSTNLNLASGETKHVDSGGPCSISAISMQEPNGTIYSFCPHVTDPGSLVYIGYRITIQKTASGALVGINQ
jgi:hypothetical protein